MALSNLPKDQKTIATRMKSDVQAELKNANPFLANSWFSAFFRAFAGRFFDFTKVLKQLVKEVFLNTATLKEFIDYWILDLRDIPQNPATKAIGEMSIAGVAGSVIPIGALFTNSGNNYLAIENIVLSDITLAVLSLSRIGTTASVTTSTEHNLASGLLATIAGADQPEYNITAEIIVTNTNGFTYELVGTPVTPATGTLTSSSSSGHGTVESEDFGVILNLPNGAQLSLASPIAGVVSPGAVQFGGVSGGTDAEELLAYRERGLESWRRPFALFNASSLEIQARKVPGVTRVFVIAATQATAGTLLLYFVRDNDPTILPDGSEITQVKDKILEIKPAHVVDDDIVVNLSTPPLALKPIDFIFGAVIPNTDAMFEAVQVSLEQFFTEEPAPGKTITSAGYNCAIFSTTDLNTGQRLESFVLNSPVGDVTTLSNEIATLGSVSKV